MRKKIDFQYFNLKHADGSIILKARCNSEYLKMQIERIKLHDNYKEVSDLEILEDILTDENVEHYVLEPEIVQF